MALIQTAPYYITKRFPDHNATIVRLFKNNESFRTLCEDYYKCIKALRHWRRSDRDTASERREEYEALLIDLEEEILHHLDKFI
jgi:hypothetical protein